MGGGGGSEVEGLDYEWNHTTGTWEPEIPSDYSLDCSCKNFTESLSSDPCFSPSDLDDFNLGLHVMAVFIILGIFHFFYLRLFLFSSFIPSF